MVHPMKKEGVKGHNDKLRRLTRDYGAADKSMVKASPVDKFNLDNTEPQAAVGFGDDYNAANPRADRASRRAATANPIATYKKGGRVKHERMKAAHRADGGDVSPIEQANRNQTLAAGRARGGRLKGKSKGTHVNVIVAPQGGPPGAGAGMPPVPPIGALPPVPPGAPPMPPGGLGAGPMGPGLPGPMAAGAPGGIPPGIIPPRKRGGKVTHPDEPEDRALVKAMVKPSALKARARGGQVNRVHMTAGAESGPGRLEKMAARRRNARGEHPQPV